MPGGDGHVFLNTPTGLVDPHHSGNPNPDGDGRDPVGKTAADLIALAIRDPRGIERRAGNLWVTPTGRYIEEHGGGPLPYWNPNDPDAGAFQDAEGIKKQAAKAAPAVGGVAHQFEGEGAPLGQQVGDGVRRSTHHDGGDSGGGIPRPNLPTEGLPGPPPLVNPAPR